MTSRRFLTFEEGCITASRLRDHLSIVLRRVDHDGMRLLITRHDRPVAAVCMVSDLEMIREWHQKSAREKELEMEIAVEAWNRARRGGLSYDSSFHR